MRAAILAGGPRLRRAILAGMVAVIPLIVVRAVNDPINVPKLGLLIVGTTIVAAIRAMEILQGADWRGLRRLWVPAAAIGIPLLIAWIASPYRDWALFGEYRRFQGLIPYVVLIAFGALVADAFRGKTHVLSWAIAAGGGAVGALALLQQFGIDLFTGYTGVSQTGGVNATLGNPNFVGGFLAITLPITATLYFHDPVRKNTAAGLSALILGGLVVSFSEGPYAAGVAGATVAAGVLFRKLNRWILPGALGLAAAVVAVVVASAFAAIVAPERSAALPATIRLRAYWWQAAAEMGADRPLVGWGPNAFGVEGVRYRPLDEALFSGFEFPDDPHSVLFSMVANAGVLGGVGFIVLLLWIVWYARRRLDSLGVLAAGFLGAVAAYFVQSLASIDEVSLRLLFWGSLGGFVAATLGEPVARGAKARARKTRAPRPQPLRRPIATAAAAALTILPVAWSIGFIHADGQVRHARALSAMGDVHTALAEVDAALDFRDDFDYHHVAGFDIADGISRLAIEGSSEFEAVNDLFAYVDDFPDLPAIRDHARLLQARAALLEARGESGDELRQMAADRYLYAVELDPLNPGLRDEAVNALVAASRWESIEERVADYVDNLGDQSAALWGALALARAELGEDDAAREAIDRALALDPNDKRALVAKEMLEQ